MSEGKFSCVSRLRDIFGYQTVLLPVPIGEKGCREKSWPEFTLEKMGDPAYLKKLESGNVAVLLGEASGNLISIDFDEEEFLEAFMDGNPRLGGSTFTKGKRGGNVFLRIEGELPEFANLKDHEGRSIGELRSGACSTVVHGLHPEGVTYGIVNEAPPVRMGYDEIVWPDFVRFPGQDEESEQNDSPVEAPLLADGKNVRINISGVAEEFAERNEVCFNSDESRFYLYDDAVGVWKSMKSVGLNERVRSCILELGDELLDQQNRLKFGTMLTPHRVREVIEFLKGITEMACEFDADPNLVHASSGVIRLTESGLVAPLTHSPRHYLRNAHDFRFVRTPAWGRLVGGLAGLALGMKKNPFDLYSCQRPTKFLKYLCSMMDPEDVELLQLWIGSVLLGGNRHQKILVLSGSTGCGKSQLSVVIEALVGEENIGSLRTDNLRKRFETSSFIGKQLLVGADVSKDFLSGKQAEMLKSLTGGDSVPFEVKGGGFGSLKGNFGVFVSTNHTLRVPSTDKPEPWRRRLMAIECKPRSYSEEIPNFGEKLLREEGDQIFTWAVYGAAKLLRQGGFALSSEQQERVEDIAVMRGSVRSFLQAEVQKGEGNITSEEAEAAYREYCLETSKDPLNAREFQTRLGDEMKSLFGVSKSNNLKRNGRDKRGYRGVELES